MAEARRGALAVRQTALALRSGAAAAAAAQDALFALPGAGRDEGAPAGGGVAGAAWESIAIREGFGLAVSSRLKWRQTQKLGAAHRWLLRAALGRGCFLRRGG